MEVVTRKTLERDKMQLEEEIRHMVELTELKNRHDQEKHLPVSDQDCERGKG